jgi:hypothetical protein
MIRAILRSGKILPLDPLPSEWTDGCELAIQPAGPSSQIPEGKYGEEIDPEDDDRLQEAIARIRQHDNSEDLNKWIREMEVATSQIDPKEWHELQASLNQMHDEAKAMMRRQMGLS